jgi:hypothetical protein
MGIFLQAEDKIKRSNFGKHKRVNCLARYQDTGIAFDQWTFTRMEEYWQVAVMIRVCEYGM